MKNQRGVCAAGWGEPCPALRDASETSTNRGNALGRGESSPQPEMGTAHLLVFEPFPYLELALVALAETPEADAEGVFSLDLTQYDMMNEGTEHLYLGSCRIPNLAEFKKILAEVLRNPFPQESLFSQN